MLIMASPTFEARAQTKQILARSISIPLLSWSTAMPESMQNTVGAAAADSSDAELLAQTVIAVRAASESLRERFGDVVPYRTFEELMRALGANDDAVLGVLRPRLTALRPDARWVEEELEGGALPAGEWWVVDPAEGNVNHLHGLPEWAVTATLVRDNQPVLTAVHLPLTGETYTALAGAGAHVDGRPLHVSRTPALGLSIVATSQARPDEDEKVVRRVGSSITLHLLNVAAGRIDAFWQFAGARADMLPGALLVAEAGGRISDVEGHPWTPASESFLAAAPGVHADAVATLSR
jgi:myo-inositol-1(or 4)-monophosphatase